MPMSATELFRSAGPRAVGDLDDRVLADDPGAQRLRPRTDVDVDPRRGLEDLQVVADQADRAIGARSSGPRPRPGRRARGPRRRRRRVHARAGAARSHPAGGAGRPRHGVVGAWRDRWGGVADVRGTAPLSRGDLTAPESKVWVLRVPVGAAPSAERYPCPGPSAAPACRTPVQLLAHGGHRTSRRWRHVGGEVPQLPDQGVAGHDRPPERASSSTRAYSCRRSG
jgi:hypothetical protein